MSSWRSRLSGLADEAGVSLAAQIAAQRELGWSKIELRNIDGVALADLSADDRLHAARALRDAELHVEVLASRIGNWARPIDLPFEHDELELARLAAWRELTGARYVRVMSYPNPGWSEARWAGEVRRRFELLGASARAHGLTLLLENCVGWAAHDAARTLELIAAAPAGVLQVLWDCGNPLAHGVESAAWENLRALVPEIAHVHVKDAQRVADQVTFTWPGEGHVGLVPMLEYLLDAGYRGDFSIEPHVTALPHAGTWGDQTRAWESYLEYGRRFEALLAGIPQPTRAA